MNTNLTFRFVTRTLSEDYRVFGNGGQDLYSDSSEFEPLRKKGRIIPEEGPCAVLYQEDGLIFLTVSSMQRGMRDIANRPIRFSFCEIFTNKSDAWSAFTRIISEFSDAEKAMQSMIREKANNDRGGEDVDFKQDKFMSWLQAKSRGDVSFSSCREGDVITREGDAWPDVWPPDGMMLKWKKSADDELYCERVNNPKPKQKPHVATESRPRPKPKGIVLALCGLIVVVVVVLGIVLMRKPKPEPIQIVVESPSGSDIYPQSEVENTDVKSQDDESAAHSGLDSNDEEGAVNA